MVVASWFGIIIMIYAMSSRYHISLAACSVSSWSALIINLITIACSGVVRRRRLIKPCLVQLVIFVWPKKREIHVTSGLVKLQKKRRKLSINCSTILQSWIISRYFLTSVQH